MQTLLKQSIIGGLSLLLLTGIVFSVGSSEPSVFQGEAAPSTVTFSLPTADSDSTTAFTTVSIFNGTGGLDSISDDQGIITSANTVTRFYLGVNGYLIGDKSSTGGGLLRFKTSQFITSITATFTKFESELSNVYIQSGWVAPVSSTTDIRESYTFVNDDVAVNVTYSNIRSYYFEIGLGLIGAGTTAINNNAYLTSLTFIYDSNPNPLSLLNSYNFIDGGTASTTAYSGDEFSTTISNEAENPSGTGTSDWKGRWANTNLLTGTRIGTASTVQAVEKFNNDGWPYIATNFSSTSVINAIYVLNIVNQTGTGVTNIILQTSSDGLTWEGISYKTLADINNGVLDFGLLNVPTGKRFRIGFTTSVTTQVIIHFTGIQVFSYSDC